MVRTERWLTVTDGPALPADVVLGPELPALPALPDEARQRAGELHERIVRVMRDLKDSMDSNRRQVAALAVTRRHNAGSAPARFVDRSC